MSTIDSTNSNFQFISAPYGTKTFANKFEVLYKNEKLGDRKSVV